VGFHYRFVSRHRVCSTVVGKVELQNRPPRGVRVPLALRTLSRSQRGVKAATPPRRRRCSSTTTPYRKRITWRRRRRKLRQHDEEARRPGPRATTSGGRGGSFSVDRAPTQRRRRIFPRRKLDTSRHVLHPFTDFIDNIAVDKTTTDHAQSGTALCASITLRHRGPSRRWLLTSRGDERNTARRLPESSRTLDPGVLPRRVVKALFSFVRGG